MENTNQKPDQQDDNTTSQQQSQGQNDKNTSSDGGLKKSDVPDSTNQSTGSTGSGQRQDSN